MRLCLVTVRLVVVYPPTYPDVIPELSFDTIDEEEFVELTDDEEKALLEELRAIVRAGLLCSNARARLTSEMFK